MKKRVVVVGGGAAGMMAAAVAAANGNAVTVLERNARTCLKLGITGKGRCNLTNNCDRDTLIANIPRSGRFLYGAFARFSPQDAMALFESLGVPLKTERGARVFPVSDRASDVVRALRRYAAESGASVVTARAEHVLTEGGRVSGVLASGRVYPADAVILATGGLSYPRTGSDGDGYRMARELGHSVTPLRPSLVPLDAEPAVCAPMQGLTLKNVRLTVYEDGQALYTDFGELLFTHFGLSGPLILSASAHMRRFDRCRYRAVIDLKPALDEQTLERRLLRDFAREANKNLSNYLPELLPRAMIPVVCARAALSPDGKLNAVTRAGRRALIGVLKGFSVDVASPRPIEEAVVTSGGVATEEIDPRTMASRLVPGLYFAGEIIDADAYTGGFNLQIAWSTGHAAGSAV